MPRHIGNFKLTPEFLIEKLGLPLNVTIIGVEFDPGSYEVGLIISHPDIIETRELSSVPCIKAIALDGVFEKWSLNDGNQD